VVRIFILHQLDDLRQRLAHCEVGIGAGQHGGRRIHELDDAGLVGGDDRITQGLQCPRPPRILAQLLLLLGRHGAQCLHGLGRNDLNAGHQQRRRTVVVDDRGGDFQARHLPVRPGHFDFVAFGGGQAGQAMRDVLVDQFGIAGWHQVTESTTDQRFALHTHQARELPVGVQDGVAVNQHRFVDTITEFGEQARRAAIGTCGSACQQMIDRGRQQRHFGAVTGSLDAAIHAPANGNPLHLLGNIVNRQQRAALQQVHHYQQGRDQAK
jgi:hypothetical protein